MYSLVKLFSQRTSKRQKRAWSTDQGGGKGGGLEGEIKEGTRKRDQMTIIKDNFMVHGQNLLRGQRLGGCL